MKVRCPCGHKMTLTDAKRGARVKCRECGRICRIPGARPARLSVPPVSAEPEAPQPPEEPAQVPAGQEDVFGGGLEVDWDDLSLDKPEGPAEGVAADQVSKPEAGEGFDLSFGSEELQLVTPSVQEQASSEEVLDLTGDMLAEAPPAAAAADQWEEAGAEEEEEGAPRTIFGLAWMCVRRPEMMTEIGVGGISHSALLFQIAVAFLIMAFVPGLIKEVGSAGLSGVAVAKVASQGILNMYGLVIVSVTMYMLANMTGSRAGFLGILSGLAFVRVLASILLVAVGAVAGVAGLAALAGILPLGPALLIAGSAGLLYVGVTGLFQIYFVMGVFDMGCMGAVALNLVALFVAWLTTMGLVGLLVKVFGWTFLR